MCNIQFKQDCAVKTHPQICAQNKRQSASQSQFFLNGIYLVLIDVRILDARFCRNSQPRLQEDLQYNDYYIHALQSFLETKHIKERTRLIKPSAAATPGTALRPPSMQVLIQN